MEMSKEKLIANILKLVDQKQYKEAYEFLMSNDCSDSKNDDTLKCFKLILGCIIRKKDIETNKFSWEIGDCENYNSRIDLMRKEFNSSCQGHMFENLKSLCEKEICK